jgi:UPF0716 protein FxsA
MILVAGILLLTPGFVTDAIGFLLFVPLVRSAIWRFVASRITIVVPGGGRMFGQTQDTPQPSHPGNGPIIDLDEDDFTSGEPNPDSPWNKN